MKEKPTLAVLFWFYKEVDVCINRLKILQTHNPDIKIYGLYGGPQENTENFKISLDPYLDDFYIFNEHKDSQWKWIHGDLMLLDWYQYKGKYLAWDSIVVVQWDALILAPLNKIFNGLAYGHMLLSGFQPLSKEVELKWNWTRPDREYIADFNQFKKKIITDHKYNGNIFCCLFMLQIMPKKFFDEYLKITEREVGMLEYKIPTYAKIFNIPIHEMDLGVRWFENEDKAMNAIPKEIDLEYIKNEMNNIDGYRVFHPYFKEFPLG